eukprot:comp22863_c0_seq1/m.36074 comp22863_c0_seq1/g.36074  ORF comp22863_c0_seq1/g.36074 comp22863_c0_seq1/m.36074 type:complete len:491 (-) comp22863_c0_seq1:492-1964(-)
MSEDVTSEGVSPTLGTSATPFSPPDLPPIVSVTDTDAEADHGTIRDEVHSDNESEDEHANEPVDPRVEGVLEEMTTAMDTVNYTENALTAAKRAYKQAVINGDKLLHETLKRSGVRSAVEKTEAYFVAHQAMVKGQEEAQMVALQYEQAAEALDMARREEEELEERLVAELRAATPTDGADEEASGRLIALSNRTQDTLNQATFRVNQCKAALEAVGKRYQAVTKRVMQHQARCQAEKDKFQYEALFSSRLERAQQYYDVKAQVERDIAAAHARLGAAMEAATLAKKRYVKALGGISDLSQDISSQRGTPTPGHTPNTATNRRPAPGQAATPFRETVSAPQSPPSHMLATAPKTTPLAKPMLHVASTRSTGPHTHSAPDLAAQANDSMYLSAGRKYSAEEMGSSDVDVLADRITGEDLVGQASVVVDGQGEEADLTEAHTQDPVACDLPPSPPTPQPGPRSPPRQDSAPSSRQGSRHGSRPSTSQSTAAV